MAQVSSVRGQALAVGTAVYGGKTLIAPQGQGGGFTWGKSNASVMALAVHFGFVTGPMAAKVYPSNAQVGGSNWVGWLTNDAGKRANESQRPVGGVRAGDPSTYGLTGKGHGGVMVLNKGAQPLPWLKAAAAGIPGLAEAIAIGEATQKHIESLSKPKSSGSKPTAKKPVAKPTVAPAAVSAMDNAGKPTTTQAAPDSIQAIQARLNSQAE